MNRIMYRNQISILLILSLIFFISLTACDKNTGNTDDNNGIDSTKTPEPFDKVPTLDDMVLYEVNFMAFGPGCSINDVTLRLDSIKDLGVNVLWLMPLYSEGELNGVGSPYCVRDYEQVNPDLGTLSDLKTLVNEAHEREMAVILDWVANHTAWDNWWIDNTDWYTQDGSGNIISPPGTNYYATLFCLPRAVAPTTSRQDSR
jgi:alpha-amylase